MNSGQRSSSPDSRQTEPNKLVIEFITVTWCSSSSTPQAGRLSVADWSFAELAGVTWWVKCGERRLTQAMPVDHSILMAAARSN